MRTFEILTKEYEEAEAKRIQSDREHNKRLLEEHGRWAVDRYGRPTPEDKFWKAMRTLKRNNLRRKFDKRRKQSDMTLEDMQNLFR